jgi:death-on-curing protein
MNHAFIDGNKRVGHAAMETFLVMNGHELAAPMQEQEQTILAVAAGKLDRDGFTEWVGRNLVPRKEV